ncbi:hypothetical protein ILUMI_21213 [Ignelater luminosus]|uniref:Major facilitator superfamily (MFS) profile domain-containing protein n=1 Tax=Ignelater luminosus TaxID=2038154 RepID=A0A8K0CGU5_IGNLU|nr:hypothetical protein ILUMI_21213 [Ignelater luminosus]
MPLIGASAGSIFGGVVLDIVGRKKVILFTSLPFFAAWIMVAYAKSVEVLLSARFLAGVADGLAFCAVPMYLGEIADPRIRGLLGSSCSISWILGMLLINTIGSYISISITAIISSVVPVLLLVTFMWMPESPYFLIMKNQAEEAKRSLRIFKGVGDVDSEFERLSVAIKEQNTNTGKFLDLFTVRSNRKAVLIIMGMRAVQQCSGTMAITFYAQTIFKTAGDDISPTTASIIYFTVQLLMTSVSSIIVDKTGRRPLLIFSIIGAGLCLFIEGLYFFLRLDTSLKIERYSIIPVIALIAFVVVFGMGLQAIPILLLGELFPTNVKAFALGLADIYFNVIATIISKFFQIVKDHYGMHVPFLVFTACCAIGLVFIIFCIPETKGKTLEEIQMELRGQPKTIIPKPEEKLENFRKLPVDV